jgi:glutathione S-transferase
VNPAAIMEPTQMYKLYYAPGAASLAAHWMLIELGAPHELKRLDLGAGQQKDPDYLRLNPNGVVPTLVVGDTPVYECAAILMVLAERHPEAALAPPAGSVARMAYLQWMVHLTNTVQAAFRHWFYPQEAAGEAATGAIREYSGGLIVRAWDRVDARLAASGGYIAGTEITAADFLAAMLMRWSRNMPKPATEWPAIAEYVARMKARPSFRTLYEREGLTEWA